MESIVMVRILGPVKLILCTCSFNSWISFLAVFYCEMGGFDAHFDLAIIMRNKLPSLNYAISNFWAEIKAQGIDHKVTVVTGSEFGRTISANTAKGSDHGWGGNYFVFGGDVKGGRILGEYPRDFAESTSTLDVGRGRLLPTTSWDALWYGITQWFGITDQDDIDVSCWLRYL